MERDDEAIARQEANETFRSITDLDSISDTMFVAITFFLAAVATWTTFAYGRLDGMETVQSVYVGLVILCVVTITACVVFLSLSLSPRGFYGDAVGDRFLGHPVLLWRNDDPGNLREFRDKRRTVRSEDDLASAYEDWLREYDPGTTLSSRESFEYSRLLNYKLVARIKAHNTAYAVALFRAATLLFATLIVFSLLALLLL